MNGKSNFENVLVDEDADEKVGKNKTYLSVKKDFPINQPQNYVILRAETHRQLFKSKKPVCMSFDGVTGKTVESGYKDEYTCNDCQYKKGVGEGENKVKCQYKLALFLEDESDPENELCVKIPYSGQKELSKYAKGLFAEGLDVPDVVTEIKRIENPRGQGGLFTFQKAAVMNITPTDDEKEAIQYIKNKISEDEPDGLEVDLVVSIFKRKGVENERAVALARMISDNDGIVRP